MELGAIEMPSAARTTTAKTTSVSQTLLSFQNRNRKLNPNLNRKVKLKENLPPNPLSKFINSNSYSAVDEAWLLKIESEHFGFGV